MQNVLNSQATGAKKIIWFTTVDPTSTNKNARLSGTLSATARILKADGTSVAGTGTFAQPDSTNAPGVRTYTPSTGDLSVSGATCVVIAGTAGGTTFETREIGFDTSSFDQYDGAAQGMSRVDAAVSSRLAPTVAARTLNVSSGGAGDANVVSIANSAITAASIAADALAAIVSAVFSNAVETGVTFLQAVRGTFAVTTGKQVDELLQAHTNPVTFYAPDGITARITATIVSGIKTITRNL